MCTHIADKKMNKSIVMMLAFELYKMIANQTTIDQSASRITAEQVIINIAY